MEFVNMVKRMKIKVICWKWKNREIQDSTIGREDYVIIFLGQPGRKFRKFST